MAKQWQRALITGASSGIGDGFARKLAAAKTDLVIVARRVERLKQLARELKADYGVDVEVLPADLSDPEARGRVEDRLRSSSSPIDLLINNAGFTIRGKFAELDIDRKTEEVVVDVVAVVRLTHAALQPMIERGRGGIINVSSFTSYFPTATLATYSAGKAFVTAFTEAVSEELRGTGVVISALCPGATPTEFGDTAELNMTKMGLPVTSVESVVDAGLKGVDRGQVIVIPGLVYQVSATTSRLMPKWVLRRSAGMTARMAGGRGK
jgi:short-subunit dehydrogenase